MARLYKHVADQIRALKLKYPDKEFLRKLIYICDLFAATDISECSDTEQIKSK